MLVLVIPVPLLMESISILYAPKHAAYAHVSADNEIVIAWKDQSYVFYFITTIRDCVDM